MFINVGNHTHKANQQSFRLICQSRFSIRIMLTFSYAMRYLYCRVELLPRMASRSLRKLQTLSSCHLYHVRIHKRSELKQVVIRRDISKTQESLSMTSWNVVRAAKELKAIDYHIQFDFSIKQRRGRNLFCLLSHC